MLAACSHPLHNRRDLRQLVEVLLGGDCRQRDGEAKVRENASPLERLDERALTADRIVGLRRCSIDGNLKAHPVSVE
jgi:hypothetical protein